MELRQFRYFVAVAEELHFSRAAARLRIGQPPLSLQIQAIERELGCLLLKRNRRRVELTEAGAIFLNEARATLEQAGRAVETARRAGRGETGTLRVHFTTSAAFTRVFTRAVRAYRLEFPYVHLDLKLATSQAILDALVRGRLDVGLIRPSPSATLPAGIVATPVHRDRMRLVLPADHPLTIRRRPVPMELLADEPFVLRPRGSGAGFYEQVFQLCADAGFTPRIVQEAAEPPTTLGLVATGMGITIMPNLLSAISVADVVWRDLAVGDSAQSAVLMVHNSRSDSNLQRTRFVELIERTAADEQD